MHIRYLRCNTILLHAQTTLIKLRARGAHRLHGACSMTSPNASVFAHPARSTNNAFTIVRSPSLPLTTLCLAPSARNSSSEFAGGVIARRAPSDPTHSVFASDEFVAV
jgi:hypothetical protein|eukprot:31025-Pelagococcus_subviridis.AAC.2